eukprot:Protomagalhaensia_sp_Gyna_25__3487@NODE_3136_length_716_cov_124_020679_g2622_i0_p1_GENE_NODE_3136_length_716_cov_124_020679_g2622_i0NODE_3136_length_716_cov_124_020679_g2622_i0_p1_ORF_typecomplete_len194_score9_16_NODE_3136_length_716_cov_124_020679_g2622_i041622
MVVRRTQPARSGQAKKIASSTKKTPAKRSTKPKVKSERKKDELTVTRAKKATAPVQISPRAITSKSPGHTKSPKTIDRKPAKPKSVRKTTTKQAAPSRKKESKKATTPKRTALTKKATASKSGTPRKNTKSKRKSPPGSQTASRGDSRTPSRSSSSVSKQHRSEGVESFGLSRQPSLVQRAARWLLSKTVLRS